MLHGLSSTPAPTMRVITGAAAPAMAEDNANAQTGDGLLMNVADSNEDVFQTPADLTGITARSSSMKSSAPAPMPWKRAMRAGLM